MQKILKTITNLFNKKYSAAIGAYFAWGVFPLYWKQMEHIPAITILFHRVLWSYLFYIIWRSYLSDKIELGFDFFSEIISKQKQMLMIVIASLLALNWLVYTWAVNNAHIVDASLGYFINPLVSAGLGFFILSEKITFKKFLVFLSAFIGICFVAYDLKGFPWIALVLSISFSIYGLFKKKLSISNQLSGQVEVLIILIFFALFTSFSKIFNLTYAKDMNYLWPANLTTIDLLLLIGSGPVTAYPLYLFSQAVQKIELNTMGLFQYMSPTLQLLIGVFWYSESISINKFIGFSFVWGGIITFIYTTLNNKKSV